MLKAAAICVAAIGLSTVCAHAKDKMRAAADWEIREYMNERSKSVTKKSNGYTYQQGKPVGYKIENGEICLLFPSGQRDCAAVETDGKRYQIITRDGDRSEL